MTGPAIKILIVEDNDFDFELLERKLKTLEFPFECKRVLTEREFTDQLRHIRPDLILSDFSLPAFSGLEALKIAKSSSPLTPFIFVSGTIGEELAVETLLQGANDYVLKDNLNKLGPAIRRALSEAKEKERRKDAERKLKIKIDELKSLIYRISHDIRGPICSVKGVVSLIQQSELSSMEEIYEFIEMIDHAILKMEGIVTNLSNFQFIYDEQIDADALNLSELCIKLQNAISEVEGAAEVDIKFCKTGLPAFFCEHHLLYAILFNLLHNSVIFRDKSKPERNVSCLLDVSEKEIRLTVEDNGIGIKESIRPRVFEMFYRGSTLSRGAGLGLYIIKIILEKMNGTIRLDSKENIGTKVTITIPALSSGQANRKDTTGDMMIFS